MPILLLVCSRPPPAGLLSGCANDALIVNRINSDAFPSGYFKKSIDIVNTSTEAPQGNASESIRFTIKASFAQPESKPAGGGRGARAGG